MPASTWTCLTSVWKEDRILSVVPNGTRKGALCVLLPQNTVGQSRRNSDWHAECPEWGQPKLCGRPFERIAARTQIFFLHEWRRCVRREAQVTLIELNGVTEKIRARRRTRPKTTKPNQKHHKPPKQPNRQSGLVSHQDCQSRSDCLEIEVKRGIEFIFLSTLSS